MFERTLDDIAAYLDFLRANGYGVSIDALDQVMEPCLAGLILYQRDSEAVPTVTYRVRHEGREIVRLCLFCDPSMNAQDVRAALAPLSYMFERLYGQCCEHSTHNAMQDAYSRSLLYIRDHYTEGISVADVARGIGYSVSYFGYIFKKNCGISANRYISDLQLAKATELLRSTALSISDIAERVGFGDANYFSTAFKARYGLSPRKYRGQFKG
jgi:AraC-like DNA-binding protein